MVEETERKDSGSGDCDCDCDCVVEWWGGGKNSLEWMCVGEGRQKECRVDIMHMLFVWLFLLFVLTSRMLSMGYYEEN